MVRHWIRLCEQGARFCKYLQIFKTRNSTNIKNIQIFTNLETASAGNIGSACVSKAPDSAVKQIYKLNSSKSGFNPDSPNGKGDQRITHNGNFNSFWSPSMPSIKWALVCVLESVCLSHCWTKCDCLLSMDGNFLIATHCQMLIALDANEFLAAKKDAWTLSKVVRTHGFEFRHDWRRVHQVKIEMNQFKHWIESDRVPNRDNYSSKTNPNSH